MANSYTKADLVDAVAAATDLKKVQAEAALGAALGSIQEALTSGKKVTLVGFGTFSVQHRASRTGRNPQTKAPIEIPASNTVKFKPGKALRDAVN
ncbi:MAG: HU family DNA-binding protein [Deltaproteobacteria bacterium]|nr:MAG: HU family DNA-binding protein [Deltaproteobacteria bacterium]